MTSVCDINISKRCESLKLYHKKVILYPILLTQDGACILLIYFSLLQNSDCHFLDYANMEHDGGKFNVNQIYDVKRLWVICKVFLLTIPYWICYSQVFM